MKFRVANPASNLNFRLSCSSDPKKLAAPTGLVLEGLEVGISEGSVEVVAIGEKEIKIQYQYDSDGRVYVFKLDAEPDASARSKQEEQALPENSVVEHESSQDDKDDDYESYYDESGEDELEELGGNRKSVRKSIIF